MSGLPNNERLRELMIDERLGQISPEELAELDGLRAQAEREGIDVDMLVGELLVALDDGGQRMPADVRARLAGKGGAIVGGRSPSKQPYGWVALAAVVVMLVSTGVIATLMFMGQRERERELMASRELVEVLQQRVDANQALLAEANAQVEQLFATIEDQNDELVDQTRRFAEAELEKLRMAERLAEATSDLDEARLEIAKYEAPRDPAELQQNRQKLAEMPGTVIARMATFDVEGLPPAEQRDVTGDVIWNVELQTGYMRFVGLEPNDPNVEVYQVWVIDDRGMEQKVSGGIFSVTAQGEVIVPIDPGIDVGRVALFAVTIEEPGGTWVPDLKRRVIVAPVEEG